MPSFLLRAQKLIQLAEGDIFDVFDFVRVWLDGEVGLANFVKENVVEFVLTPLVPLIGFGRVEDSGTGHILCGHFGRLDPYIANLHVRCFTHEN